MEGLRRCRTAIAALAIGVLLVGCDRTTTPSGSGVSSGVPTLGTEADALDESLVTIEGADGQASVDVKVADTDADRRRGLMDVAELPAGAGMLFLFDDERTGGFWMRDTLVPLDIAYIGGDGEIETILAMVPCDADEPAECPTYAPDEPYRAALEVPQGWFASAGVQEGAAVTWSEPTPPSVRS